MATADVDAIENLIVAYFDLHPRAMDTAKGIADWWLLPIGIHMVQIALERLERRGVLERCGALDDPLFRRRER